MAQPARPHCLEDRLGGARRGLGHSQVPNQQLAVNLSLAGNSYFQAADTVAPYVMGTNGPVAFQGFGTAGTNLARRQTVEAINNQTYGTIYERAFAGVTKRAVLFADRVNAALTAAPNLVALPNTGVTLSALEQQLRTVAKLIAQRDTLSMTRQIFFVSTGGFDSHDDQNNDQPVLLANISSALSRFYAATEELGVQNSVVSFHAVGFRPHTDLQRRRLRPRLGRRAIGRWWANGAAGTAHLRHLSDTRNQWPGRCRRRPPDTDYVFGSVCGDAGQVVWRHRCADAAGCSEHQ